MSNASNATPTESSKSDNTTPVKAPLITSQITAKNPLPITATPEIINENATIINDK